MISLFLWVNPGQWLESWVGQWDRAVLEEKQGLDLAPYELESGLITYWEPLTQPDATSQALVRALDEYPEVTAWLSEEKISVTLLTTSPLADWFNDLSSSFFLRGLGNPAWDNLKGLYVPRMDSLWVQLQENDSPAGSFWHEVGHALADKMSAEDWETFELLVASDPTGLRNADGAFFRAYEADEIFAEIVSWLLLNEGSTSFKTHAQTEWVRTYLQTQFPLTSFES